MTSTERRKREREERRQRILQAARELFVEEGFANASVRKIAERAEYSTMALYQYFATKEDLLLALCRETFQGLTEALEKADRKPGTAIEKLKRGLRIYVDFGLSCPNDYFLTFMQPATKKMDTPLPAGESRPGERAFDFLRQSVARCIKEGTIRADIEAASHALWAAVHGVTSIYITGRKPIDVAQDQLINLVIDATVTGLSA